MDVVALSNRQSSDLPFRRKTTTYTLQQQTSVCVSVSVCVCVGMEAEQVDGCNFIGVCARVCVCVCVGGPCLKLKSLNS